MKRLPSWTAPAAVAAAATAAFLPALLNGFVSWDDGLYLTDNPGVRGLTADNVRWAFTSVRGGFWQPLTWLSFQLDYSLWGLDPGMFHLTSLLLHAAAAVVFYHVAEELLGGRTGAALLAALFFAVHPLRVESVAWATERKGLLSGLFFLLAALGWLRGRPRLALAAFAASLAAKPMGSTLPFALLVVEAWRARGVPPRKTLLGLAPFFVLSAASVAATYLLARGVGLAYDIEALGPLWRVSRVIYGLAYYPLASLWPAGLSPYRPPLDWFGTWSWPLLARAALLAACGAACWRLRRRRPALAAVAVSYAVMLAPMSGVVQQGLLYAAADRFSYLPALGFALLFGAAFAGRGRAATAGALVWLAALGAASWAQCGVWRDSRTLWTTAAERAPGGVPLANLGAYLVADGRSAQALPLLEKAAALEPRQSIVYENLGLALRELGREAEARAVWRRGLTNAPSPELSALLGRSLGDVALLAAACGAAPERAQWRVDLGDALAARGRGAEAAARYAEALALSPSLGRAHNNLGLLLARSGRPAEAAAHYREALRDPATRARAHLNWGNLLLASEPARAERHYRRAVAVDPRLAGAHVNLGNILARRGRLSEAAGLYRAALLADPANVEARANLESLKGVRPND